MAMPVWLATSAKRDSISAITFDLSVLGHAAGDLLVIVAECLSGQTMAAPTGWTDTYTSIQPSIRTLRVFTKVSDGTETSAQILDSGNHQSGVAFALRDPSDSGLTLNFVQEATQLSASTLSWASYTTNVDNALIVSLAALSFDGATNPTITGLTNSNQAAFTQREAFTHQRGSGGGIVVLSGELASAGATGLTTCNLAEVQDTISLLMIVTETATGGTNERRVGTADGVAAATGAGVSDVSLPGSSAGVAAATGAGLVRVTGSVAGTANVVGDTQLPVSRRVGLASGEAAASGIAYAKNRQLGTSTGLATVLGSVVTGSRVAGLAEGSATSLGVGYGLERIPGTSTAGATVTGVGKSYVQATGLTEGSATVVGVTTDFGFSRRVGTSVGRAVVDGVGLATIRVIDTLPPGESYDPNRFRFDLPSSIRDVSDDLFGFLRDQTEGLREFNNGALYGALRIPQNQLTSRYAEEIYPLGSRAAVQLSTGHTSFVEFVRFTDVQDTENPGRLVYRTTELTVEPTGSEIDFAGIDYTFTGEGEFGWVIYGGYAPIHVGLYSGESPAVVGAAGIVFSTLTTNKYGVINDGMIHLRNLFQLDGAAADESIATQIAEMLARLNLTENQIATLQTDLETISGAFGQFKAQSLIALSRLEEKLPTDEFSTVYSEFLEQTAAVVALGQRIEADRVYIDAQTSSILGYANAAYSSTLVAQSHSKDSLFWATASETRSLVASAHAQNAATQAGIAQTFSVAAGESAASASAALAVFASLGVPTLVENSGFDTWEDPNTVPDKWNRSDGLFADMSRQVGFSSAYAFRLSVTASRKTRLQQRVSDQTNDLLDNLTAGWYVLECDVKLVEGAFNDMAIGLLKYDSSLTLLGTETFLISAEESAGVTIGSGTVGNIYRIRKLVELTDPTLDQLGIFLEGGDDAVNPAANYRVDFDRLDVRVATPAEIATETVLESVVAQVASIQTSVNTLVTDVSAQASSITTLTSQYTGLASDVSNAESDITTLQGNFTSISLDVTALQSSLATVESDVIGLESDTATLFSTTATHTSQINTLTTGQTALTSSVTSLESRTDTVESDLTTQASTIATHTSEITTLTTGQGALATSVTQLEAIAHPTGNLLDNSQFAGQRADGTVPGWNYVNTSGTFEYGLDSSAAYTPSPEHAMYAKQGVTTTNNAFFMSDWIPVTPGQKLVASALCLGIGAIFAIAINWGVDEVFDSSSSYYEGGPTVNDGSKIENYTPIATPILEVPAGKTHARFVMRRRRDGFFSGESHIWMTRPQLAVVPDGQTTAPAYMPSAARAFIEESATAISTLEGYTEARFSVAAVAGGRAQLEIYADANGGAGVDIIGDVGISGDLVVDGTISADKIEANGITDIDVTNISTGVKTENSVIGNYVIAKPADTTYVRVTITGTLRVINSSSEVRKLLTMYLQHEGIAMRRWDWNVDTSQFSYNYANFHLMYVFDAGVLANGDDIDLYYEMLVSPTETESHVQLAQIIVEYIKR